MTKKLPVALAVYVAIALLGWFTLTAPLKLDGRETRIGALVVAFMAFLAVRTLLHWWRERGGQEEA